MQRKANPVAAAAPKKILLENPSNPPFLANPPSPQFPEWFLLFDWKMGRRKKLLIKGHNITENFWSVCVCTVFVQFFITVFVSARIHICLAKGTIFQEAIEVSDDVKFPDQFYLTFRALKLWNLTSDYTLTAISSCSTYNNFSAAKRYKKLQCKVGDLCNYVDYFPRSLP